MRPTKTKPKSKTRPKIWASAAAATPAPQPKDAPGEKDYVWDLPKIEAYPDRRHSRDLPISSTASFDDVSTVRYALNDLERGQFAAPAQLCESFGIDDRIVGVMQTRVDALCSLPLEVTPRGKKRKAAKIADRIQEEWPLWFADAEVKKLLKWGLYLRVGVAEVLWDTSDTGTWTPRLKTWDPRHLYWRWDTRSFWLTTLDGPVEVRPGTGRWVLYCPDGYARGWMSGLVRSLGLLFLVRRWAWRDWSRHSEVHGLPIKKVFVPPDASVADKEDIVSVLQDLGGEGILRLARGADGKSGFDVELLEAASQSWDGFRQLIEKTDECIAVDVLGQNLTTSAKSGGSYALGDIHDRIRMDRVESDAATLGMTLTEQVIKPWTFWNYGDVELSPRLARWSTKPPERRDVEAKILKATGDAVTSLKNAGLPVDLNVIATQFKIPLTAVMTPEEMAKPAAKPPAFGAPGEKKDEEDTTPNEPGEKPATENEDTKDEDAQA